MPNWIFGTDASETVHGTDGVSPAADDIIWGQFGDDVIYGYGGNDYISGGPGADTIYGGAGSDTVQYTGSAQGVRVNLATGQGHGGTAQGDRLYEVENLRGSGLDDTLEGDHLDNVLDGYSGRDTLKGGGDDHLLGDAGNDVLKGGGGADTLDGGADIDTASYNGSPEAVIVLLELDHASGGDAHEDELNDIENLVGSAHDDHLWGTDAGNNVLNGEAGHDSLKGFGGADTLLGGSGNDTLEGGQGGDRLTGGAGGDTFKFGAMDSGYMGGAIDHITDFQDGTAISGDRIDLSAIDANTLAAYNNSFRWIGNENDWVEEWGAGQLRYFGGFLEGDTDGDFNPDIRIQVTSAPIHDYALVL